MLSANDESILTEFARRVRDLFPSARIMAFGSRARGEAEQYSDFDICIVLNELSDEAQEAIRDISWEVAYEHNMVFNTVAYSIWEFEEGPTASSPLVANILREGIAA